MKLVKCLLASLVMIFLASSSCTAASTIPPDDVFRHISAVFENSVGYQSTSHVTFFTVADSGGSAGSSFDINETVEKPNKLSSVTTKNGQVGALILADGRNLTIFNAPKLTYITVPVAPSDADLIATIHSSAKVCLSPGQDLGLDVGLTVPYMFFDGTVKIKQGVGAQFIDSAIKETDGGKSVIQLIQSMVYPNNSKIDFAILIDPVTYLPVSFSQYFVSGTGKYVPLVRQDFSRFVTFKKSLPVSGYSFVPPPGSVPLTK